MRGHEQPPHACALCATSKSTLGVIIGVASRARAIVRCVQRRTFRRQASDFSFAWLSGAAASLPRSIRVTLRNVGEPPMYALRGVSIYGLDLSPKPPELPSPDPAGELLRGLVPTGLEAGRLAPGA